MECSYWRNVEHLNPSLWSCASSSIPRRHDGDLFKGTEMKLSLISILEWVPMPKEELPPALKKKNNNNNNAHPMAKFDED